MLNATYPDSLFFRLQRTCCFGQCPVFTVHVYKGGYTEYNGIRFVDNVGEYYTWLTKPELKQLSDAAKKLGYFDLPTVYDRGATDFPSTYSYLHFDGRKHAIKNRQGAPRELKDFEKLIDGILARKELRLKR